MSSRYTHYWCYVCRRPIRLRGGQQLVCPACRNDFIEEVAGLAPRITTLRPPRNPNPRDGDEGFELGNRNFDLLASILEHITSDFAGPRERDRERERGPFFIFTPGLLGDEPRTGLPADLGNYFVGPNLDQLIQQLTQNDRCGPPPAPRSAIDSLPIVKVNSRHLRNESECPVCQEKFQIGSEVREMPCKHIYHNDCIVPWLNQHNSCPICRTPLQERPSSDAETVSDRRASSPVYVPIRSNRGGNNGSSNSATDNANRRTSQRNERASHGWRGFFAFLQGLWPFRSSGSHADAHRAQSSSTGYCSRIRAGWPGEEGTGSSSFFGCCR